MTISAELQAKIDIWRAKAVDGTLSLEEMVVGMRALRGERVSAASQSTTARRAKAVKVIPKADDLLNELGMGDAS